MLPLYLSLLWTAFAGATCYEPSEAHHLPKYDPNDVLLRNAFASVGRTLDAVVSTPQYASTSFSVEVTSSIDTLWSHHHTALQRNASRPDVPIVNGDTLYRIASITKSFTVLGILYQHAAGNLSLDDPIDKYIGDLKGEQEGTLPWKDITLRSLASQLSGIPRDFAQGDLINPAAHGRYSPEELGLPPASKDGLLECDEYAPNYKPACGRADLIKAVKSFSPVFAPNQQSTYSNVAYELLGVVLANATGQTYESYITNAIFRPLNMSKSTLSTPPDSAGVIPLVPHYWGIDEGIQNPTGGIYASTIDLSKYLRYVLTHYNGITHALNWIHPVSPAQGLNSFYGMPWEIFQTDRVLENSRRTIKFITKAGGLPGYTSIIMAVPQYDLGITILVAGNSGLFSKLLEIVTVQSVRIAEQLAILQLEQRYAGTYVSSDPSVNSSVTLTADRRGLIVTEFISNSTDILASVLVKAFGAPEDGNFYTQLTPNFLYRNGTAKSGELWRLTSTAERNEAEQPIWDDFCMTNVDGIMYAGLGINEVVLWEGEGDAFESLELTGFRTILYRRKHGKGPIVQEHQQVLEL